MTIRAGASIRAGATRRGSSASSPKLDAFTLREIAAATGLSLAPARVSGLVRGCRIQGTGKRSTGSSAHKGLPHWDRAALRRTFKAVRPFSFREASLMRNLTRFALSTGAAALFAGCGASQPPVGAATILQDGRLDAARYSVLHAFKDKAHGYAPQGLIAANGRLYGLTFFGGVTKAPECADGCGVLFTIAIDGSAYKVLRHFSGGSDGAGPIWIFAQGSDLYGVTYQGGGGNCKTQWFTGCGTAFHIGMDGSNYSVLHRFSKPETNGSFPSGLAAFDGGLYGTTLAGGKHRYGTVFRMSLSGANFSLVHSFAANGDGASPTQELAVLKGTLFGTTMHGGTDGYDDGTVFSVNSVRLQEHL